MELLQTTTLTNTDISSAVLAATYTADDNYIVQVQIMLSGLAGNGTYRACLTKQRLGAGAAYQSATTSALLASSVTTCYMASAQLAVSSTDVIKVYLQGLGTDSAVNGSVQVFGVETSAADTWAYSSRTLTQSGASVVAAVEGSVLTITRGDTFSAALTNIGALTGYVSLDFTVKKNQDDTDANAILRIRKNATGLTDGLITINKVSTDLTATNGSITIDDQATGDITIALAAAETDDLVAYSGYFYDVQMITATGVTTLTENICNVAPDVTRAVS